MLAPTIVSERMQCLLSNNKQLCQVPITYATAVCGFPLVPAWPMVAVAIWVLLARIAGHVPEVGVFVSAPAASVLGADTATVGNMRRTVPVRTSVASQVFEGRVGLAAVFTDVFFGLLALKEDMIPLAGEAVRAAVAQECLFIGIFLPAALAVHGGGLLYGFGILPFRRGGMRHAMQAKHGSQQRNRDGKVAGQTHSI